MAPAWSLCSIGYDAACDVFSRFILVWCSKPHIAVVHQVTVWFHKVCDVYSACWPTGMIASLLSLNLITRILLMPMEKINPQLFYDLFWLRYFGWKCFEVLRSQIQRLSVCTSWWESWLQTDTGWDSYVLFWKALRLYRVISPPLSKAFSTFFEKVALSQVIENKTQYCLNSDWDSCTLLKIVWVTKNQNQKSKTKVCLWSLFFIIHVLF